MGGRFPSNVILDTYSAGLLDEQSGELHVSYGERKLYDKKHEGYGSITRVTEDNKVSGYKDRGGASRFFYVAKAKRKERDKGLDNLENQDSTFAKGIGTGYSNTRPDMPIKNNHPTVKPLKLLEYLCTLTSTPTKGIVLDPFMGSGTTGIACINTGRDFIGIEIDEHYFEIAEQRIQHARDKHREEQSVLDL